MSSPATHVPVPNPASSLPLCVDLDGTLSRSDTLHDAILTLIHRQPSMLLRLPFLLRGGKAAFKHRVAAHVLPDAAHLPYNQPLLDYLRAQHATGRTLFLATASDEAVAHAVSAHLGIFSGTLGSDGVTNFSGKRKLAALRERFPAGFAYIGNSTCDAPILAACAEPMVANPTFGLRSALRRNNIRPTQTFLDRTPWPRKLISMLRVHQWAKNTLIFLPMLLAHGRSRTAFLAACLAFVSFSLCASATYIVNDMLDVEADRRHATKRNRPFAAGELSIPAGLFISALLGTLSLSLTLLLPHHAIEAGVIHPGRYGLLFWILVYAAVTLSYSLRLKRMLIVDTVVLACLYTLRLLAGSSATGYFISPWLGAFALFLFLSLAFVKRFSEMENLRLSGVSEAARSHSRAYRVADIDQLRAFGTAAAFAAIVVFTLYINNPQVTSLYLHPARLWLMPPILTLWLCRIWIFASRGQLHEDPVVYAITDKRSLQLGVLIVLAALYAAL
jgi:4-hydroxybenzoate polyprenyltransferase/phosphoserine phosphatase